MPELKVATFDCYGTLVDSEGGLGAFLYDLARRSGDSDAPPGSELRRRWEEIQFELVKGSYRSYRDVLEDALRTWVGERGYRWNVHDAEALERAMQSWQPFPDSVPALERAQAAGLRLAIVSNTDRYIMAETLRQLRPLEFEAVVVAEDARAYKPDTRPFTQVLTALAARPGEIVHVAGDLEYDIAPAASLGFRTAWVNRRHEPPVGDAAYDYEWDSLWRLSGLVES
jgi:2-haloalkanoic acid dehalogenase type II